MIIELDADDPDGMEEDFDTADFASETPERIAKAFAALVEMNERLEHALDVRTKALTAVGLTFDVLNNGPFIGDRAQAVAGHARMLTEFDEDEAHKAGRRP